MPCTQNIQGTVKWEESDFLSLEVQFIFCSMRLCVSCRMMELSEVAWR